MKVDKSKFNLDEQVVYDDSLKDKDIDAIDKKAGLDFKDQGKAKISTGGQTLLCEGTRSLSALKRYQKNYANIRWNCKHCNLPEEECTCG